MTIRVHSYEIRDGWPVCKNCGTVRPKTRVGEPTATGPRWCPGRLPEIKTRESVSNPSAAGIPTGSPEFVRMSRRDALAVYRRHGLLLAQFDVREDVALKLIELEDIISKFEKQVRHCERNHVECEMCGASHCECGEVIP